MPSLRAPLRSVLAFAFAVSGWSFAGSAHADTLVIRHAGDHSRYSFEAEPHLLLGIINPPGTARGEGVGAGFRGTVIVLDNGFVPSINNSIGVGFGLDWVHYTHGALHCVPDMGPAGGCYTYDDTQSVNDFWVPVVMQWNFFLSRQWSVFGEPGLALRYESVPGGHAEKLDPQLYVGGRWHFADQMTLTLRLGYPTFSAGVSFM